METVARLNDAQRRELFSETATIRGTTPAVIEKDFWVTRSLARLFQDAALGNILRFKGGTSLSKVYGIIERFSEDIDLVLDWRLLTGEDPVASRSKTQQNRLIETLNAAAVQYIKGALLERVQTTLGSLCACALDADDPCVINISYPAAYDDEYLRPEIRLEIGPLASWTPHETRQISSYAADTYPQLFTQPVCTVQVISAERTFWEKVTILHQEAHRPDNNPQPSRYSRHYYDLALMSANPVKEASLRKPEMLQDVVRFKQQFYPRAWAHYDKARPGTLKLIPTADVMVALRRDYREMQTMIFGETLDFDTIVERLQELQVNINSLVAEPIIET